MSYYTDKIIKNYNKSKLNYNYDDESDEEESDVMTEQYESESNDNLDNKFSYGGGAYSNQYGGMGYGKSTASQGISKYLNPGKLLSSSSNSNTQAQSANKLERKVNPYARSTSADPYKSDTYNIDIDLNKIKKDSETFQTNKNKINKDDNTKTKNIKSGWNIDSEIKESGSEIRDDSGKNFSLYNR